MPSPTQVRFTPDQLKVLWEQKALDPEDMAAMHPDDQKVLRALAAQAENDENAGKEPSGSFRQYGLMDGLMHGVKEHPGVAAATLGAAAIPLAAGGVPGMVAAGTRTVAGMIPWWIKAAAGGAAINQLPVSAGVKQALEMGWGLRSMGKGLAAEGALAPAAVEAEAGGMPANITRLRPGSGASADQVGEHLSTQIHDPSNSLGLSQLESQGSAQGMSRLRNPDGSTTGGLRLRSPNGNGRFGETPFGLDIKDPKLFKELQALEAELSGDPAQLEKVRAMISSQLGGAR